MTADCVASPPDWSEWLAAFLTLVTISIGIRQWFYGGSVLKVTFELGVSDGLALERAAPIDFADPVGLQKRFGKRINNPRIDVVVLTVRNLGRTAATVSDPGLSFSANGLQEVFVGGVVLPGFTGDTSEGRVRLEAHDSWIFVLPLAGMVEAGLRDLRFQAVAGAHIAARARAQVTAGTGRRRRSRRFALIGRRWQRNWWAVSQLPLDGRVMKPVERLVPIARATRIAAESEGDAEL